MRYNSITAKVAFLARTAGGQTIQVNEGETCKLQDHRDTESGQVVHFALPGHGLVTAISKPEGSATAPWQLKRV